MNKKDWTPFSWQRCSYTQAVDYPDSNLSRETLLSLQKVPPLIDIQEIDQLKQAIAQAQEGKAFLLQGGDCAELFKDCQSSKIDSKLYLLSKISSQLTGGLDKPIIVIGRMAGQYAKPRTHAWETKGATTLLSYRGDLINDVSFENHARIPNPQRMLSGYYFSEKTLNHLRNYFTSFSFLKKNLPINPVFHSFYISHEALHLPYESALTRTINGQDWYNQSAHFLWLGMRTGQIDGAHIEYLRGISNPIAVKVGPLASPAWIKQIVEVLNPNDEPGRLTLITRLGEKNVSHILPSLIDAVKATGIRILWCCDPMHGNTIITQSGYKTRRFEAILSELEQTETIHRQKNSYLGGLHIELTGENVTECLGGSNGLQEMDLPQAYESAIDPRLNHHQSLQLIQEVIKIKNASLTTSNS
jgi:3-deoxy-7-phosphoheptulonate synthase